MTDIADAVALAREWLEWSVWSGWQSVGRDTPEPPTPLTHGDGIMVADTLATVVVGMAERCDQLQALADRWRSELEHERALTPAFRDSVERETVEAIAEWLSDEMANRAPGDWCYLPGDIRVGLWRKATP